jgi:short-subunit dehydrogenase
MFENVKGKRALIAGASGGIGNSIVKLFSSYGVMELL